MTTQAIINEINAIKVTDSDDYEALERIYELTASLRKNTDGYLACEALVLILERHPDVEFGTPGAIVHLLESYPGYYESYLFASIDRLPTYMTVWMLNRIINGTKDLSGYQELLSTLKKCTQHAMANDWAKESALEFYRFQTE